MTTVTLIIEQLANLLTVNAGAQPNPAEHSAPAVKHRWVIVRGDRSGVFYGLLVSEVGQTVELTSCRHLWEWWGAANTAELAGLGVSKPKACKFTAPVKRLRVLDAIEVIDCTQEAILSLDAVPVWSKR